MTIRRANELIDYILKIIGNDFYLKNLQDYLITLQGNPNNVILLVEITDKAINDYKKLIELEIPSFLNELLLGNEKPFTQTNFYDQLIALKNKDYSNANLQSQELSNILTQLQSGVKKNISELNNMKKVFIPFTKTQYLQLQNSSNAIFAIVFNNKHSYQNLKSFAHELKKWDRGLFIYQQIVSDESPKPFEIIEIDEGSVEIIINLLFDIAEKLLEVFKSGLEVYAAYLAYKTVVRDNLIKSYKGNEKLLASEREREKLLLENVREAVRAEIKEQSIKNNSQEAVEKKIDEVTKLISEHIIKGNSIKLLSAPPDKKEIFEKEQAKESAYLKSKNDYKKLDEETRKLLLDQYTTIPPEENYEV